MSHFTAVGQNWTGRVYNLVRLINLIVKKMYKRYKIEILNNMLFLNRLLGVPFVSQSKGVDLAFCLVNTVNVKWLALTSRRPPYMDFIFQSVVAVGLFAHWGQQSYC